jgi:hypothetical protein
MRTTPTYRLTAQRAALPVDHPRSMWNREYLASPEGRAQRHALEGFERGTHARSVRDFPLEGKTLEDIRQEAGRRGFGREQDRPLNAGPGFRLRDGGVTPNPNDTQVARHLFLIHQDGGMIRIKPDGEPRSNPNEIGHRPSGCGWTGSAASFAISPPFRPAR